MDKRKIVFNSIRMRIIQFLIINQEGTTSDISRALNEVPRTTLYRHMAALEEAGILKVVAQRRVRGTIEKTYSINPEAVKGDDDIENAKNNAFTYLMGVYGDFYKYFSDEDNNDYDGRIFIRSNEIYMSDKEFDNFIKDINNVFEKYENSGPGRGKRLRKITTISAPDM